ncbi:hypothetical protein [Arthrobacter sp. Soil762]|uniref:hypothetical protein n=1 Tax=Arthrobacter sp. Soil762 TaxID=1736401 RepID=UPI0006F9B064|nr:hypothetical protein [Arthrobacter sp. Soil762]KRE71773.1 hypothetical protein ASG77_12265 [Arthrobacter sp. Soil762]
MFRTLARLVVDPTLLNPAAIPNPDVVFAHNPRQLSRWLEEVFAVNGVVKYFPNPAPPLTASTGQQAVINGLKMPPGLLTELPSAITQGTAIPPGYKVNPLLGTTTPLPWDHLIYAFLLENTGIVEILGEVVRRYKVGETLAPPSVQTLVWARNTEELFFRDPPAFHILGVSSQLRPDARVNRRNAYWRMFGRDLSHPPLGAPLEGQPWKRDVGAGTNARFFDIWEELLRQVWQGILNDRNQGGPNATDRSYIAYLCQSLSEMLTMRRRGGMLAQEEFAYVTMLNWFHLTVEYETPVVRDLKAEAGTNGNPADRLAAIGARVGITPPRESRELFELAGLLSPLMWFIENGAFNDESDAEMLYHSNLVPNPVVADAMIRIIDLWQSATGTRIKDPTVVSVSPDARRPAQPLRLPEPTPTAAAPVFTPSSNGNKAKV